jgi:hypothetical protein
VTVAFILCLERAVLYYGKMTTFSFVLVAAAFLWLIGATIRSPERKKFFGLALLAPLSD